MLIDVTDANGIDIPRFCYHKKLSVAASCRMCLVDVEKAPKPLPACATPVMDGMVVRTRSDKAREAQKSVMEFLLINHPLDCPICDQGGECELQDVAVGYGQDNSRYHELKRVVADKNLGPLIATEMTRCIHCTRCVRFSTEIAGIREMGAPGRGEHMQIGTYVEKTIDSELSGNMTDVCPVGALTSKPFRFSARAWELRQHDSIAPHDGIGSNLHLHVRRNEVMRVVPKTNEAVNEVWLSDRDRFSYTGLKAEDRLLNPMIKKNGAWEETDWETALAFAAEGLRKIHAGYGGEQLAGLAHPNGTLEEFYLLQKLLRGLGSNNLDHRLHQTDFSDQAHMPLFPSLVKPLAAFEQCDAALIIGSHLRKEQPLLNHRLRKAALADTGLISERCVADIMLINAVDYEANLPIAEKRIVPPTEMLQEVAAVLKAAATKANATIPAEAQACLATIEVNTTQQAIAERLLKAKNAAIILGHQGAAHPHYATLRIVTETLARITGATLSYATSMGNSAGACLAGMLPHRGPVGAELEKPGMHWHDALTQNVKSYVLLGIEPELDTALGETTLKALQQAEYVVSLTAYKTPVMDSYADVLLPIALFAETSGTHVNNNGLWQSYRGAVAPPGEARPAWKVLRVLANLLAINGFDYASSEQICEELRRQVPERLKSFKPTAWSFPATLPQEQSTGLQRISELPIYAVDGLVRRAPPLQETHDGQIADGIHLHPEELQRLSLTAGQMATVKQDGAETRLAVVTDERVPPGCALLYSGQTATQKLGKWHGSLDVTG